MLDSQGNDRILDYSLGIKEYINEKLPPDSEKKNTLVGQKQQQYITEVMNRNLGGTNPEAIPPAQVKNNKGWGKV